LVPAFDGELVLVADMRGWLARELPLASGFTVLSVIVRTFSPLVSTDLRYSGFGSASVSDTALWVVVFRQAVNPLPVANPTPDLGPRLAFGPRHCPAGPHG
jgi:hypothetical protein